MRYMTPQHRQESIEFLMADITASKVARLPALLSRKEAAMHEKLPGIRSRVHEVVRNAGMIAAPP